MKWVLIAFGILVAFLLAQMLLLAFAIARVDRQTEGLGYFGLPPAERDAFKAELRRQTRRLAPALALLRLRALPFDKASFESEGLAGPRGSCSEDSFAAARAYAAAPEDIFVATQMKCGTTWMQHLVYQVLTRGRGDLVGRGTALYAVSPWLEARMSVSLEEAPLLGEERPSRVIKTHLPREHCPFVDEARYIYVARHPVSCFASTLDFLRANVGPLRLDPASVESWFASPEMWWGPWPRHVSGWWTESQRATNVLFVRFEDMKNDLAKTVVTVADFLGMQPLTDEERSAIVGKCDFGYMSVHAATFEMHPPHLFNVDGPMFVRGTVDRHRDVDSAAGERILSWCRSEMAEGPPSLEVLYPSA
ncbi:MAG: sulfotransferase domain-containing protein [Gemmatimonadetes bacterium]|nr:sulfotransferase domain-containing protein [Gemmatimonadota bacterium]